MLQSHEGAGRYINAFRAPFQKLPPLSGQEVYVLRACSLLVIPPPPLGRVAPQGGFPADLMEINLLGWASLVQDVAAGLQVLPPGLQLLGARGSEPAPTSGGGHQSKVLPPLLLPGHKL